MGYVILPIGVPAGMSPEDALNDNERYRVVWQILNALRSHDERFDAMINKMDLGVDVGGQIEVIAVSNKLPTKADKSKGKANIGHGSAPDDDGDDDKPDRTAYGGGQIEFVFDEFSKAIMAKIVKKCGRRDYWENWASDIAKIAQTHITRISTVVERPGKRKELKGERRKMKDSDLARLRREDPWERLRSTLIDVFQTELSVAPFNDAYHSYIRVETIKGSSKTGKFVPFSAANARDMMAEGTGFLQWLSVYSLALDHSVDVILLDEPDAHGRRNCRAFQRPTTSKLAPTIGTNCSTPTTITR